MTPACVTDWLSISKCVKNIPVQREGKKEKHRVDAQRVQKNIAGVPTLRNQLPEKICSNPATWDVGVGRSWYRKRFYIKTLPWVTPLIISSNKYNWYFLDDLTCISSTLSEHTQKITAQMNSFINWYLDFNIASLPFFFPIFSLVLPIKWSKWAFLYHPIWRPIMFEPWESRRPPSSVLRDQVLPEERHGSLCFLMSSTHIQRNWTEDAATEGARVGNDSFTWLLTGAPGSAHTWFSFGVQIRVNGFRGLQRWTTAECKLRNHEWVEITTQGNLFGWPKPFRQNDATSYVRGYLPSMRKTKYILLPDFR